MKKIRKLIQDIFDLKIIVTEPKEKIKVSQFKERIPLYDIKSDNIYLIFSDNIYSRIINLDYRFLDEDILELTQNPNVVKISKSYDLTELKRTYYELFYESFTQEELITTCRRPSFIKTYPHIKPFYSLNEMIFIAKEQNLISGPNDKIDRHQIKSLCLNVSKLDIPSETLKTHQQFIDDSKKIGLVKYYSLFGSYLLNQYLRNPHYFINEMFENQINLMKNLILKAPAFNSDHIIYRFIDSDKFLENLKIGDIFMDKGFMSTTRNPFLYKDKYQFGYILLKIRIPKNIKGLALCIESYSNFPDEEEIILPPQCKLKLKKIDNVIHESYLLNRDVTRRYEFDYVLEKPEEIKSTGISNYINTLKIDLTKKPIFDERLESFMNQLNKNFLININLDDNLMLFHIESYNSRGIYKNFFRLNTEDGILMYSINQDYGNINISIEISEEIHVNYYFKHSVSELSNRADISQKKWIDFLARFAYSLGVRKVVFYPIYSISEGSKEIYMKNIYEYLKSGIKYYVLKEITPSFNYYDLDLLSKSKCEKILSPEDKDELWNIYMFNMKGKMIADFYIYIVDHYPHFIQILENHIGRLFRNKNPLFNIEYVFDTWLYLYNNGIINEIPDIQHTEVQKTIVQRLRIPQFVNRIRYYMTNESDNYQ